LDFDRHRSSTSPAKNTISGGFGQLAAHRLNQPLLLVA
jgi:hypothetical protein